MKSILLPIRLKYFYLTYKGIKTVEIRKTCPKNFVGDVYEYVSKTNFEKELLELPENEREFFKQFKGKVGLKFTVRKAEEIELFDTEWCDIEKDFYSGYATKTLKGKELYEKSCLNEDELWDYLDDKQGYAYYIEDLVVFDKPKELWEFKHYQDERIKVMGNPYPMSFFGSVAYHYEKKSVLKPLTKAPQNFCYVESEE